MWSVNIQPSITRVYTALGMGAELRSKNQLRLCLVGKCVLDHFKFMSLRFYTARKKEYKSEIEKSWVTIRGIVVAHVLWLCAGASEDAVTEKVLNLLCYNMGCSYMQKQNLFNLCLMIDSLVLTPIKQCILS